MASIIIISQARCLLHSKQTKTNHKHTHKQTQKTNKNKLPFSQLVEFVFCLIGAHNRAVELMKSEIEKTFIQMNPLQNSYFSSDSSTIDSIMIRDTHTHSHKRRKSKI